MEFLHTLLAILWNAFTQTLGIALAFFGIMLLLGLMMYLLARFTRNLFAKSLGPRAELFITAWVGTPVHEMGHAVFCLIFGHRITKVRLFTPNSRDGSLGMVEHTYNRRNLYQRAGGFFIGAGPVIFGSLVILALLYLLVPNGHLIAGSSGRNAALLQQEGISIVQYSGMVLSEFGNLVRMLFSQTNLSSWQFWIFLYLVLAIASHMELSPPDISQMLNGLLVILMLIFAVSLFYAVFFPSAGNFLYAATPFIGS
ncbi:MAG: hypothetical protein ACOCX8_03950, partial [Bacteroidota bacterium]